MQGDKTVEEKSPPLTHLSLFYTNCHHPHVVSGRRERNKEIKREKEGETRRSNNLGPRVYGSEVR